MDGRSIGVRVRSARLGRGLTLETVAGLAGHSKSWLSKVERGLLPLESRHDLAALATALSVSPTDLTGQPYDLPTESVGGAARDAIPALRRALLDRPVGGRRELAELRDGIDQLVTLHDAAKESPAVGVVATVLNGLRASVGGRDHREVAHLTVLASYHATWILQAVSRHDLAFIVTGVMDRAAADAEDPVTTALAAITRSYSLAQVAVGAYGAAVDVASDAADAISAVGGAEAAAALGHLQLAAGFASAALRNDDEAATCLHVAWEQAGRVTEPTLFGRHLGFGAANVRLHQVAVCVELGQAELAVQASTDLEVDRAPNRERAACWLADLGRAHAALEQDAEAVRAFRRAEAIAPLRTRLHPLVREAVAGMVGRAQRAAVGRDLRGLAHRMGMPH
ncbi:MAG TPA: helix-turn-helix domain-containing protein [Mycobacteriales bacterium]|nr:helix-turn-helix domain-containing protein [Mycobacteriales bacterium]